MLNPDELIRKLPTSLRDRAREDFNHRAAIVEFDGEMSREFAEMLAMHELRKFVNANDGKGLCR
jgi:hypothetical protein